MEICIDQFQIRMVFLVGINYKDLKKYIIDNKLENIIQIMQKIKILMRHMYRQIQIQKI